MCVPKAPLWERAKPCAELGVVRRFYPHHVFAGRTGTESKIRQPITNHRILMRTSILALLTTLAILAQPALAGPFRSVSVVTGGLPEFTLDIPKGKAITIVNFQDASEVNPAQLSVQLNVPNAGPLAVVLTASAGNQNSGPAQKDLTICGPATITIDSGNNAHLVYLCYKIFGN